MHTHMHTHTEIEQPADAPNAYVVGSLTLFNMHACRFWVILSIVWGLIATVIAVFMPLIESYDLIWNVAKNFFTWNLAKGDHSIGEASQHPDPKTGIPRNGSDASMHKPVITKDTEMGGYGKADDTAHGARV